MEAWDCGRAGLKTELIPMDEWCKLHFVFKYKWVPDFFGDLTQATGTKVRELKDKITRLEYCSQ